MRAARVADTSFDAPSEAENGQYMIADSAFPAPSKTTSSSSPTGSSSSTTTTGRSTSHQAATDVEQGMEMDDNATYFKDVKVAHKTAFSRTRVRAGCMGLGLLFVLFILFQLAFRTAPNSDVSPDRCDLRLSAPYVSNRNLSWEMCTTHQGEKVSNFALKAALLPDSRKDESALRFLVLGDFGRDGYCCQRDVAIEMNRAAADLGVNFIVNTGDAFYDSGLETAVDEQVRTSFLNVYNQSKLRELNFYSVIGNHEYRGSANALLALDARHSKRWTMPSRYWSRTVSIGTLKVQFVFLDTSPMIESYRIPGYDTPEDLILKRRDGITSQWSEVEKQMAWLEDLLSTGKYDSRIVVGHHPVYGLSAHKGENRTFIQTRIAPLLERYNVTAYFAGHDHNLQFAQVDETAHFISGAGSKVAPAFEVPDTPKEAVNFYYMEHGFLACTLFRDELRVAAVDLSGKVLETVSVDVRGRGRPNKG